MHTQRHRQVDRRKNEQLSGGSVPVLVYILLLVNTPSRCLHQQRTQGGGQFAGPLLIWGWKNLYSSSVKKNQFCLCLCLLHTDGMALHVRLAMQYNGIAMLGNLAKVITCHMLSVHHHRGMQTSVWYVTAVICTQHVTCGLL